MPEKWTAGVVGKLHLYNISKKQLAEELNFTPEYVSMVLNGHRTPTGAENLFNVAVERIINSRNNDNENIIPLTGHEGV